MSVACGFNVRCNFDSPCVSSYSGKERVYAETFSAIAADLNVICESFSKIEQERSGLVSSPGSVVDLENSLIGEKLYSYLDRIAQEVNALFYQVKTDDSNLNNQLAFLSAEVERFFFMKRSLLRNEFFEGKESAGSVDFLNIQSEMSRIEKEVARIAEEGTVLDQEERIEKELKAVKSANDLQGQDYTREYKELADQAVRHQEDFYVFQSNLKSLKEKYSSRLIPLVMNHRQREVLCDLAEIKFNLGKAEREEAKKQNKLKVIKEQKNRQDLRKKYNCFPDQLELPRRLSK